MKNKRSLVGPELPRRAVRQVCWRCTGLALLLAAILIPNAAIGDTEMKSQNIQIIEGHYAASSKGDMEGALRFAASDIEWTEMAGFPYEGTYIGSESILENVFSRLGAEWSVYTVEIDQLIDGGDTIVALGRYAGTYKETGSSFKAEVAHVWTLKDGKIVKFVQYTDTLKVAEAMR